MRKTELIINKESKATIEIPDFGCCEIELPHRIKSFKDINEIIASIDKELTSIEPIVLDYKLLRVEKNDDFAILQEWVKQNLHIIMKRGLNHWKLAAELIFNVPRPKELEITTGTIGYGREILLIGIKGDNKELAIALPKKYIEVYYYDWFSLPKNNCNPIKETIEPAVIRLESDGRFTVIKQGKVKQD